tara:strand:+ start:1627 stop:2958 length:1332 start_codon:yes stop_codon:yes gene_type:complete
MRVPYFFLYLIFACSSASTISLATEGEHSKATTKSYEPSNLIYRDHVYKENIKSVQLYVQGDQMTLPIIFLNDQKRLELHFDDFETNYQVYNYKFIHCNADWQPSGLVTQEYISGFFDAFIEDYKYSFNTLFSYIHYSVSFPNEDIQFKLSGNYLLVVYANNDENDLVLSKQFHVVDKRISIETNIHMATLARHRDYKQEVDFTINHASYPIQDPYLDLKVIVAQNRRWDNAITNLKPLFVQTPKLVYNYEDNNLFDGNNEYRFFDAKDLRYQSMNIDRIQINDGKTDVFITPDEPRSHKRYYFQPDINGRYLIKNDIGSDSNREGDYMIAHFTLIRPNKVNGGDLYVFGELSDWEFKEEFKMEYDELNGQYKLKVKLKQGYYNYAYAFLPTGETKGDLSVIEGTHSETENNYYFFVYHRQNGEIYDRLIGFEVDNSSNTVED